MIAASPARGLPVGRKENRSGEGFARPCQIGAGAIIGRIDLDEMADFHQPGLFYEPVPMHCFHKPIINHFAGERKPQGVRDGAREGAAGNRFSDFFRTRSRRNISLDPVFGF